MYIDYSGIKLNVEIPKEFDRGKDVVLLLHGFTGCSEDWLPVIDLLPENVNYICLDLIGHGKSDHPVVPEFYYTDSIADQIKTVK